MLSSAQLGTREALVEIQSHFGYSNERLAEEIDWDPAMVGIWRRQPGRITSKASKSVFLYYRESYLGRLPLDTWIINELTDLRAATMLGEVEPAVFIDQRLPTLRRLHSLVPPDQVGEGIGASYVLGLALFIRFTARTPIPFASRANHVGEMEEALHLLEHALRLGTQTNLLTPYMLARIGMQIPGGYYNLHEHELCNGDAKLGLVRAKLIEHRCIEATWAVHRMTRKDPTPLHNGVVFGCALGDLEVARQFKAALVKLDRGFEDPLHARDGLTALGRDPMVKRFARELYK
ncbi:MAG TPA: hypothetical protein VK672_04760 [Solirubrobacteraceae bacterium]|jgi:hypothetical protein|nr:hypothetical protein [Solirubrobacteraceae bacterium]